MADIEERGFEGFNDPMGSRPFPATPPRVPERPLQAGTLLCREWNP